MTRDEATKFAPIVKAFGEGKTIQFIGEDEKWHDFTCGDVVFADNPEEYRIKPEAKYRPFKDAQECWDEMLKHQPFGWVKAGGTMRCQVDYVADTFVTTTKEGNMSIFFQRAFCEYTFADGTLFGIEEGGEQ